MTEALNERYMANLALYEKLIGTNPDVDRKGATMPYTSLNGHMFSFLTKEGRMALRLPSGERESFLEMYKTGLCVQYGAVMKEYVEVPDALLEKTQDLKAFYDISYGYVSALKPKPTRKKAGAKKKES